MIARNLPSSGHSPASVSGMHYLAVRRLHTFHLTAQEFYVSEYEKSCLDMPGVIDERSTAISTRKMGTSPAVSKSHS